MRMLGKREAGGGKRGWFVVALLALPVTLSPLPGFADEIYYTSGARLKGLVVEEHADRLIISTVDGERVVPRRDIDQVFFDEPERNYLYLGNEALADEDLPAAAALYQKALQLNPAWDEAHDAVARLADRRRKVEAGWRVDDPVAALGTTWGLRLDATSSTPAVAALTPSAPADQAGFQVDDRIVAVWGESMAFRPLAEVAERLLGPTTATPVKVTIERLVTLRAAAMPPGAWPGCELALAPAGVVVAAVRPVPASAGVRVGDLVVAVNDQVTRYLPLPTVRAALVRARGGARLRLHRSFMVMRP